MNKSTIQLFGGVLEQQFNVLPLTNSPPLAQGHAVGLSFSILSGTKQPPSLRNILTELESDIGTDIQVRDGDLTSWSEQGVLLLNTTLTVTESAPNSHKDIWGDFATHILSYPNAHHASPLVFILWGRQTAALGAAMECTAPPQAPRKYLYSAHPSPLSSYRGFFDSKPFSQTNAYLVAHGCTPIHW